MMGDRRRTPGRAHGRSTDSSSATATWQALLGVMHPLILTAAFNEKLLIPVNRRRTEAWTV